ncbi:MAG: hypothetical protein PHV20_02495 [Bacteroidales bacterium]|nr:hypothetical protein [Bacteroidales bacterium]
MKKITISISLFFGLLVSAFCQSNFKNGYIITNRNDTISGLIDFRTDEANSLICKFKLNEKNVEQMFQPGMIAGYRFINEGKYYVSHSIVIDSIQKTVFLEFLVQGLLNLYYLPEGNGYYFFENAKGEMISTTKKQDEITHERKIKTDTRYQGVLAYILKDDLPLATKTSEVFFDRKSMIEYTKRYHSDMCDSGDKCIIFENDYKKKFTKFDISFYSGIEFNEVKFDNINLTKMQSISPIIGVGLNISSPRSAKSLSLMFDATLSKIAGACDYSYSLTYFQYRFSEMKANFTGGLEYIYPKGKFRPALNLGFSYRYFFNSENTLTANSQNAAISKLAQLSSNGIYSGIGLDYQIKNNKFFIARLSYSKQTVEDVMNSAFQLKIGYKF